MTRSILFITLVFISTMAVPARTIQGIVKSEKDSIAIEGATCRLMSGEQFINGIMTGSTGHFEISTEVKTELRLEVSMSGYSSADIVIEKGKNFDVGDVYLGEVNTLGELEVKADYVIDSKGRTIIFPSATDVKASTSALSLFQKLPLAGLEANPINRTISVDGGTPVILIDGVPSAIDDFNALQPKDIAKIEY